MRCSCCNKNLNDFESTLKDINGVHLDTCRGCLKGLGIPVQGRTDLDPNEAAPSDWFDVGQSTLLDAQDESYFEDD
jgi:hypothetical protein